jgi:hypothetical protein
MTVTTAPDEFYQAFTERNRGLISSSAQQALRESTILIAGCGSTGGAAVEPLVRLGIQRFLLAEPGEYELNNLNRQDADYADIGRNKAVVAAERISRINPHANVVVETAGVQPDNVEGLVSGCDIVVDGVDVTTPGGWQAKIALHETAAALGRPAISGYDMSGTQYIRFYDYRGQLPPLDGIVTAQDLDSETVWDLLRRIIPADVVPEDLRADVRANSGNPDYSVPQLVYTSMLFGVLTARYVVEILSGTPVRESVWVDVHGLVRA